MGERMVRAPEWFRKLAHGKWAGHAERIPPCLRRGASMRDLNAPTQHAMLLSRICAGKIINDAGPVSVRIRVGGPIVRQHENRLTLGARVLRGLAAVSGEVWTPSVHTVNVKVTAAP